MPASRQRTPIGPPNQRTRSGKLTARSSHHYVSRPNPGVNALTAMSLIGRARNSARLEMKPSAGETPAKRKHAPRALTHEVPVVTVGVQFHAPLFQKGRTARILTLSGDSLRRGDYDEVNKRLRKSGYGLNFTKWAEGRVTIIKLTRSRLTKDEVDWLVKLGVPIERISKRFTQFPLSKKDVESLIRAGNLDAKVAQKLNKFEMSDNDVEKINHLLKSWSGHYSTKQAARRK